MSVAATTTTTNMTLTNEEYDERKRCLEELKKLVRSEQEQIFFILKRFKVEYSENSNGVFFDMCRVPNEAFSEMQKFLQFCQANRTEFEARDREISRLNLSDLQSIV